MTKKTIYFVCTGNACRSQMAEGLGKEILGEEWNVYSGGIEAHGVNPKVNLSYLHFLNRRQRRTYRLKRQQYSTAHLLRRAIH